MGLQVIRKTLLYYHHPHYYYYYLTGVVCFGGVGEALFSSAVTCDIWRYFAFYSVSGLRALLPEKETSLQPTEIEFEIVCLCPAVPEAPLRRPLGGICGSCAARSNDTPSE